MTLSESQRRFTKLLSYLLLYGSSLPGYELVLDSAARSVQEQERLFRIGVSKTLDSGHVKRLAADLIVFYNGALSWDGAHYETLGAYWKRLDPACIWGGDWDRLRDYGHFELGEYTALPERVKTGKV